MKVGSAANQKNAAEMTTGGLHGWVVPRSPLGQVLPGSFMSASVLLRPVGAGFSPELVCFWLVQT